MTINQKTGILRSLEFTYSPKLKIDGIDKEMLTLLSTNGRMSVAALADKTGLSRDGAKYRLDRLVKNHVIEGFACVVNPHAIGLPLYSHISLALWNLNTEREKELVNYLKKAPYIVYSGKTMGRWDMFIEVYAKDAYHLDSIIAEIRNKFSDIIKEVEMSPIIREYKWTEYPGTVD